MRSPPRRRGLPECVYRVGRGEASEPSLEGGEREQPGERLAHGAHFELALELDYALARGGKLALGFPVALAIAQHDGLVLVTRAGVLNGPEAGWTNYRRGRCARLEGCSYRLGAVPKA